MKRRDVRVVYHACEELTKRKKRLEGGAYLLTYCRIS